MEYCKVTFKLFQYGRYGSEIKKYTIDLPDTANYTIGETIDCNLNSIPSGYKLCGVVSFYSNLFETWYVVGDIDYDNGSFRFVVPNTTSITIQIVVENIETPFYTTINCKPFEYWYLSSSLYNKHSPQVLDVKGLYYVNGSLYTTINSINDLTVDKYVLNYGVTQMLQIEWTEVKTYQNEAGITFENKRFINSTDGLGPDWYNTPLTLGLSYGLMKKPTLISEDEDTRTWYIELKAVPSRWGGRGFIHENTDGGKINNQDMSNLKFMSNTSNIRTLYCPTTTELANLGSFLYSSDLIGAVKQVSDEISSLGGSVSDYIVRLIMLPVTIERGEQRMMSVGPYRSAGVALSTVAQDGPKVTVNLGTMTINGVNGNYLDYQGEYNLFLPFYGIAKLSAADVVNKQIGIEYVINIEDGNALIRIKVGNTVKYIFSCNVGFNIPVGANNLSDNLTNAIKDLTMAGVMLAL